MRRVAYLLVLVAVVGCATYVTPLSGRTTTDYAEYYREWYVKNHPNMSVSVAQDIIEGIPSRGMLKQEFLAVKGNQQPDDINTTTNAYGTTEQWCYGDKYYYFENGQLDSWQE